jgi:hypothetical protein
MCISGRAGIEFIGDTDIGGGRTAVVAADVYAANINADIDSANINVKAIIDIKFTGHKRQTECQKANQ